MSQVESKKPARNALLETLYSTYPVFRDCQPLAIGVHKLIREKHTELDRATINTAMRIHTHSTRYLKAMSNGQQRFDLSGQAAGEITDEQRQQATDALRERLRKAADQRRAEQQAQKHQENLLKLAEKFNRR